MSLGGLVEVAWCLSRNPSNYYGAPWRQPQQPPQAPPQHLRKPAQAETNDEVLSATELLNLIPEPDVSGSSAAGSSDAVDPLVEAVLEQRRVPREARR